MRTSVLFTVLAVALVIGTACKGPDGLVEGTATDTNAGLARGANVSGSTDTLAEGTVGFNTGSGVYTVTIGHAPAAGPVDSIMLITATAAASINTAVPTAVLCSSAGTCAAGGTATLPGGAALSAANLTALKTSIRAYGTQLVFTTTNRATGGAMRGTMYPIGQ